MSDAMWCAEKKFLATLSIPMRGNEPVKHKVMYHVFTVFDPHEG